jgi:hypothetical protein
MGRTAFTENILSAIWLKQRALLKPHRSFWRKNGIQMKTAYLKKANSRSLMVRRDTCHTSWNLFSLSDITKLQQMSSTLKYTDNDQELRDACYTNDGRTLSVLGFWNTALRRLDFLPSSDYSAVFLKKKLSQSAETNRSFNHWLRVTSFSKVLAKSQGKCTRRRGRGSWKFGQLSVYTVQGSYVHLSKN